VAPPHDKVMTIPRHSDDHQAAITYAQKPAAGICRHQCSHDFKHGLYMTDIHEFISKQAALPRPRQLARPAGRRFPHRLIHRQYAAPQHADPDCNATAVPRGRSAKIVGSIPESPAP
jgi:hypothetical protein